MYKKIAGLAMVVAVLAVSPHEAFSQGVLAQDTSESSGAASALESVVDRVTMAISDANLRALLDDVLQASPVLAAGGEQVNVARHAADAVGRLTDPQLSTSLFLLPPETRVGAQTAGLGLTQKLPPRGLRAAQRRVGKARTDVKVAAYGALALSQITAARIAYHELQFVLDRRQILEEKRAHLSQHEEIARSRYATGFGRGQDVIKLQAEISRVESELLMLAAREQGLLSRLNGLRDRSSTQAIEVAPLRQLPDAERLRLKAAEALVATAVSCRPEMAALRARGEEARAATTLAEAQFRPGWTVGFSYTHVRDRDDPAARLTPPEDNGQDIVALHGSLNLPLRRQRLAAEAAAAESHEFATQLEVDAIAAEIRTQVEDLRARIPLIVAQLEVSRDLLTLQAEEALESARSGYVAGTSSALDLLDAEHLLFETRTTTARTVADLKIAVAQLERAVAGPVAESTDQQGCTI